MPLRRCTWVSDQAQDMVEYHDHEWGTPRHDDRGLFEFLALSGMQAGLSWSTVLRKRAAFRAAFDSFDIARIARYDQRKMQSLLCDPDIIRNRLKLASVVNNARVALMVGNEFGSFANFIWQFVDGKPIINRRRSLARLPASTRVSDAMSKELKRRGFTFVGTTICYAYMQSVGMVNDHTIYCFRYAELCRHAAQRAP